MIVSSYPRKIPEWYMKKKSRMIFWNLNVTNFSRSYINISFIYHCDREKNKLECSGYLPGYTHLDNCKILSRGYIGRILWVWRGRIAHWSKIHDHTNLILRESWDIPCITMHEGNILWKYDQDWTREIWKMAFFQILYLIKLY